VHEAKNKMKKTRIATISLLLVLLTVTTLVLYAGSAKAANYNIDWGHWKRTNPDYYEIYFEQSATYAVKSMFSYRQGWTSWYVYGGSSTESNLLSTIDYRQQNDVWASDFWVGDFYPTLVDGTMHYLFYGENYDDPMDANLYDHTTTGPYSKQHFTFIWTCACANNMTDPNTSYQCYGFIDYDNDTGEVGMPLAWTANADLSHDGYSDPDSSTYCYIGFKGASKPLKEDIYIDEYYTGYKYFGFVDLFYTRLTLNYYQYTVKQSLDYASGFIWGCDWDDTPLGDGYYDYPTSENCWMNVFGNSNLYLP
jgi:hypothetical protein